jgi:hypothetical protein
VDGLVQPLTDDLMHLHHSVIGLLEFGVLERNPSA